MSTAQAAARPDTSDANPFPPVAAPAVRLRADPVLRHGRRPVRSAPGLRPRRPPRRRRPARAVRGVRPVGARPALPALAADRADLRPREPQAGLLPVDGVPDRPVAGQQRHEPAGRAARRARPSSRRDLDWLELLEQEPDAGLGNGGLGPAGGLLPRLAGHAAAPGDGLRPALRVRHLPPGDPGRLAGRAAGQLAAPARPVGGRPARRDAWR